MSLLFNLFFHFVLGPNARAVRSNVKTVRNDFAFGN
jgi:hypothetical protein